MLLGRGIRFLLASALLVLLAVWMDAKGIVTANQVRAQGDEIYRVWRRSFKSADPSLLRELKWSIPWDWTAWLNPSRSPGWMRSWESATGSERPGGRGDPAVFPVFKPESQCFFCNRGRLSGPVRPALGTDNFVAQRSARRQRTGAGRWYRDHGSGMALAASEAVVTWVAEVMNSTSKK